MTRLSASYRKHEAAFSLVEILVVVGIISIVLAIVVLGILQTSRSFALRQAASVTASELRKAQASAMAAGTGVPYTVEFVFGTPGGLNVYKQTTLVRSITPPDWPTSVQIDSIATTFPNCTSPGSVANACVTFFPLGYPNVAGAAILRGGTAVSLQVNVAAATGRVNIVQQ